MNCETFLEWSEQLLQGRLLLDRLQAARDHVKACRRCRERLERRFEIASWEAKRHDYWRQRLETKKAAPGA